MEKNKVSQLPERLTIAEADARYGLAVAEPVRLMAFDREMAELAEKMIGEVMAVFDDTGIDLDYTEESLGELDDLIQAIWKDEPIEEDEALDAIVSNWGAYFAQVIRQHVGGEWIFRQDLEHASIRFARAGFEIFPLHKLRRRLVLGEGESLTTYYERLLEDLSRD